MERLTEKHYDGNGHYMKCSGENPECDGLCGNCNELDKIVEKLAAYEDTGLEPGEVVDLMGNHGNAIGELRE